MLSPFRFIQAPISPRISRDWGGIFPLASGPTFNSRLPPLETHSTSFLMSMGAGLKKRSSAQ